MKNEHAAMTPTIALMGSHSGAGLLGDQELGGFRGGEHAPLLSGGWVGNHCCPLAVLFKPRNCAISVSDIRLPLYKSSFNKDICCYQDWLNLEEPPIQHNFTREGTEHMEGSTCESQLPRPELQLPPHTSCSPLRVLSSAPAFGMGHVTARFRGWG